MKMIRLKALQAAVLPAIFLIAASCAGKPKVQRSSCPLELERIHHSREGGFSIEYYKGWIFKENQVRLFFVLDAEIRRNNMSASLLSRPELKAGDVDKVKEWMMGEINEYMPTANVVKTEVVDIQGKKGFIIEILAEVEEPETPLVPESPGKESGAATPDAANPDAAGASSQTAAEPVTADTQSGPVSPDTNSGAVSPETAPANTTVSTPQSAVKDTGKMMIRTLIIPRNKEALQFTAVWDPDNERMQQTIDCMFNSITLWY